MQNIFHIIILGSSHFVSLYLLYLSHFRRLFMTLHSKSEFISSGNKTVVGFYVSRVHETTYAHLYNA